MRVGWEETNKNKNSGYEKEEGERKALVLMAKMLQKPTRQSISTVGKGNNSKPYPIPTHSYQCTSVVTSLEDRQSYNDTQPTETR